MKDQLFSNVKYLTNNEQDMNWDHSIATVGFQSIAPHSPSAQGTSVTILVKPRSRQNVT